jgi:exonuclease SbcC
VKLDRIVLHSFLSHGDTDWAPDGARLATLVGPNGSGKSSLLDAVAYALFDDARARTDDLVQLGATDMSVVVEFAFAGERYRVSRGRTTRAGGKSYLELAIAEGDGWRPLTAESIRETQEAIAALLRMDAATFRTAAFLGQGRANAFAEATASERKRILGTVLGLDRYARAEALAREQARDLEGRTAAERAQVERHDEQLARRPELEAALAEQRTLAEGATAGIAAATEERAAAQARLVELTAALAGAEQAAADVARLEAELGALRERYRRTQERLGASRAAIAAAETVVAEASTIEEAAGRLPALRAEAERLEELEREALELERAIATRRAAIADAGRDHDRAHAAWQASYAAARDQVDELAAAVVALEPITCPRCGASIVVDQAGLGGKLDAARRRFGELEGSAPAEPLSLARERAALTRQEARARTLEPDPEALAVARRAVVDAERTAARAESLAGARATLSRERAALDAGEAELVELDAAGQAARTALEAARRTFAEAEPIRTARGQAQSALTQLERAIEAATEERRVIEHRIAGAESTLEALAALEAERDALAERITASGIELERLRRLVGAFGVGGIPARIIESVLPELAVYANELLGSLRPGMTLDIRAQRAKRDGKGLVEALDLVVRDDVGERPLALFSGGERMSVSLALAVGLSRLVARRAGTAIRTLVIDEPDGLDAEARRAFGAALRILAHHGELERVVLVSHHEDLAEVGDAIYQVTKNGRGSVVSQIA